MRLASRSLLAALTVASMACSGNSTSPSSASTFNMNLKDSPFTDGKALYVTFTEVSAHSSGGPFQTLTFAGGATTRTCDLKQLTSAQDVLGTAPLAPGHYTQVRLTVESATIYFDKASTGPACGPTLAPPAGSTSSAPVTIPSGTVYLNREFDVPSSGATTMLVDFDGDQSVHAMGNGQYSMTPVISVVSVQP